MPVSNLIQIDILFRILDAIEDGVIFIDRDGRILYMNKAAELYRGIKNEERLGTSVLQCHPGAVHEKVREVLENFKNGVCERRHKIIYANGKYYENLYNVVRSENGEYLGIVLETRDITDKFLLERKLKQLNEELERKVQERTEEIKKAYEQLHKAQEFLIQAEKMTSIGRFVSGLAHEIYNPLDGIQNCIRAVLSDLDDKQQVREYLNLALEGLFKIELLVRRLLDYARPHMFEKEEVNVNDIIDEALSITQFRIKDMNIEVIKNLSDEDLIVVGDGHYLEQVFTNIILNAIDAMEEGGKLEITSAGSEEWIEVSIKDNGCGIPEEIMSKIFEPFFTTKRSGTGLGLYLSYNVVASLGGRIEVKSKVGEGSEFKVILPRKIGIEGMYYSKKEVNDYEGYNN
jgi:PAS domain S-box-containing protein